MDAYARAVDVVTNAGLGGSWPNDLNLTQMITDAIREAEREARAAALEEAARLVDRMAFTALEPMVGVGRVACAQQIRALAAGTLRHAHDGFGTCGRCGQKARSEDGVWIYEGSCPGRLFSSPETAP